MKNKTKQNIGMFILSLILIGYGYILGRTSTSKKEDEGV